MKMAKLKFLYWGLYLALCFTSVWFVSGVVDNFLSKKTSFSQTEGYSYERPVITIALTGTGSGNLKCCPIPPLLDPLDTPGLAVHGGVFDVTITLKAWK